jgi:hypothetical protein
MQLYYSVTYVDRIPSLVGIALSKQWFRRGPGLVASTEFSLSVKLYVYSDAKSSKIDSNKTSQAFVVRDPCRQVLLEAIYRQGPSKSSLVMAWQRIRPRAPCRQLHPSHHISALLDANMIYAAPMCCRLELIVSAFWLHLFATSALLAVRTQSLFTIGRDPQCGLQVKIKTMLLSLCTSTFDRRLILAWSICQADALVH